jgi:hypothetical protein
MKLLLMHPWALRLRFAPALVVAAVVAAKEAGSRGAGNRILYQNNRRRGVEEIPQREKRKEVKLEKS